jgi:hypothetical protein
LSDRRSTRFAHGEQSSCPIISHASHDDAESLRAGVLRATLEEHFDRRLVSEHARAVGHADNPTSDACEARRAGFADKPHVTIPGGEQGAAGNDGVAIFSLLDLNLAKSV